MPTIRPSSDLRNKYNEISTLCHEKNEPVYITKNGKGDLAIMSMELWEKMELYMSIERGIQDMKDGKEYSVDEVFDELENEV